MIASAELLECGLQSCRKATSADAYIRDDSLLNPRLWRLQNFSNLSIMVEKILFYSHVDFSRTW